jgi:hypothetical protein
MQKAPKNASPHRLKKRARGSSSRGRRCTSMPGTMDSTGLAVGLKKGFIVEKRKLAPKPASRKGVSAIFPNVLRGFGGRGGKVSSCAAGARNTAPAWVVPAAALWGAVAMRFHGDYGSCFQLSPCRLSSDAHIADGALDQLVVLRSVSWGHRMAVVMVAGVEDWKLESGGSLGKMWADLLFVARDYGGVRNCSVGKCNSRCVIVGDRGQLIAHSANASRCRLCLV